MRDYGKVSPQFWTGKTGKALRGHQEAQIVALYLMTSPHSTMIGVFNLPMLYLQHETGLSVKGASEGLARCIDVGFCVYDEEAERVFVVEMAAHQIGDVLQVKDLRHKGVLRQYAAIADTAIGRAFFDRYGADYSLPSQAPCKPLVSPLEGTEEGASKGASKPHSPAPAPAPVLIPDEAKPKRAKKSDTTLADWIASLGDEDVVPADDPLFGWASKQGIPSDWLGYAWAAFEDRYAGKDKTYADWRAAFRDHVKRGWLDVWRLDNRTGGFVLTTAGEQYRREVTQ